MVGVGLVGWGGVGRVRVEEGGVGVMGWGGVGSGRFGVG